MASSTGSEWVYIHPTDLDYQPLSSTNTHICVIPSKDPRNKYSNNCLVFEKEGVKTFPIVHHQGWWYELYQDKKTNQAFLGPFQSEVHATDVEVIPTEGSVDDQDKSETDEDNKPEADQGIRCTSININPAGPVAPHSEHREPWAPLITPT